MSSGYDSICSDILYWHLQQITLREQCDTPNHRNAFKDSVKSTVKRQWHTHEFCSGGGGVQQIQLMTEDRENGDLGAAAP